ncbi:MAG: outer membrane beta-barrel protein [Beijerinckiaceae bacterium]|nr:outer membrane beta-barrel protein [Beijerinckiaceae bacterium]
MLTRALALGSVTSLALLAGGALAADLPVRAPAPAPVYAPVFTWTGFYVGVNGGYGGDKFQYPYGGDIFGIAYSGKPSITSSGALFGAQIGYNWQFANRWVIGVEADYQWSNIEGQVNINGAVVGFGNANVTAGSEVTSFGTIRARLGYGWDRALLYVTGGWAYGRVDSAGAVALCPAGGGACFGGGLSRGTTHNGWVAGLGLEYALTNNLSFKTEYLYVDLGDKNLYSAVYPGIRSSANLDVETRFHVVRAGLNYRFNWGAVSGPVVAAY